MSGEPPKSYWDDPSSPIPERKPSSPKRPLGYRRRSNKPLWPWILGGCGIVLVGLFVLVVVAGVLFFVKGADDLGVVCESFLTGLDQKKYDTVYMSLGAAWKSAQSHDEFQEFFSRIFGFMGSYKGKDVVSWRKGTTPAGKQAKVTYTLHFSKGDVEGTFTLVGGAKGWVIQGAHFESPVFAPLLTCPKCGKVHRNFPKFCSDCGTAIGPSLP